MSDLYGALGVARDATPEAIKSAYYAKVKTTHPDVMGGDADAFIAVQGAYEVLSDPDRRAAYDRDGSTKDQRIDADLTQALSVVERLLAQVMGEIGEDGAVYTDLVAVMAGALDAARDQIAKAIETNEREIAKLRKFATRFSVAEGKQNRLALMVEYRIAHHEKAIAGAKQAQVWHDKAAQILTDYSFTADPKPAPQANAYQNALGAQQAQAQWMRW